MKNKRPTKNKDKITGASLKNPTGKVPPMRAPRMATQHDGKATKVVKMIKKGKLTRNYS